MSLARYRYTVRSVTPILSAMAFRSARVGRRFNWRMSSAVFDTRASLARCALARCLAYPKFLAILGVSFVMIATLYYTTAVRIHAYCHTFLPQYGRISSESAQIGSFSVMVNTL